VGKLTIIKADGTVTTEKADKVSLEDLQEGVGGYIETVPYFDNYKNERCVAFCNEYGKLNGDPMNGTATRLWWDALGQPVTDYLVGDIVIVQGADLLENL
jgi:hypothetical protein